MSVVKTVNRVREVLGGLCSNSGIRRAGSNGTVDFVTVNLNVIDFSLDGKTIQLKEDFKPVHASNDVSNVGFDAILELVQTSLGLLVTNQSVAIIVALRQSYKR